ncbi:hypothetical protein [Endozoicomonas sp.]|uniref:hypothetical protein n=1 Tax=Endozoicomonas sp. TaxID=1892382 RepID=UPI003AF480C5
MTHFTTSPITDIGGGHRYKSKSSKLKKSGKFKLRKVVKTHVGKLLHILKKIGSIFRIRMRHRDLQKNPTTQTVQLQSVSKINEDGDRIPDDKTIQQVKSFVGETKDLPFALSKAQYHRENEEKLNERSQVINGLKRAPNWEKLRNKKAELEKPMGDIRRELNEAFLTSYTRKAKQLLRSSDLDEVTKRDLKSFLDGKDEYSAMTLEESKRVLIRFQQRIASHEQRKKREKEGYRSFVVLPEVSRILPARESLI